MIFKGVYHIRLISAESVVSAIYQEMGKDEVMHFANPMEVQFYPRPQGSTMLSLSPWMPFGDKDQKHEVYTDTVVSMSKCNQEMVDYYNSVVIKYNNGFIKDDISRHDDEEDIASMDEVEESLDIIEAMTMKAKGKLH